MESQAIVFDQDSASSEELSELLHACSSRFMPPLDERVDLDSYSTKLFNLAKRVEAWRTGVLIGFVAVYLNDPTKACGFISNVCVRPGSERQGVAAELIRLSKNQAMSCGFTALELEVHPENKAALALYERSGFKRLTSSERSIVMRWTCTGAKEQTQGENYE